MPVKHLLIINHGLVNENLEPGLTLKVPRIAHSHVVPVAPRLIKEEVDVLNSVVQVDAEECIGDGKTKSVVGDSSCRIIEGENLGNVTVGPTINRIHAEPSLHCEECRKERVVCGS